MRARRVPAWCAAALVLACGPSPDAPALDLPPRSDDAAVGSEIARDLRELDLEAREERIVAEVVAGNVPGWLRRFEPVRIDAGDGGGASRLTVWVTPDYLSVGSEDDYLYVPLSPRAAHRLAVALGASLPAPAMVDAAWSAARIRLIPIRIPPDEFMGTVRYFERHNSLVQAQRRLHGARPGYFVAGHKLDVVLLPDPDRADPGFGVYGWHQRTGARIQPLYPFPTDAPPHYSMGVRLVHGTAVVDGVERDLADLLRDPVWARRLAGE